MQFNTDNSLNSVGFLSPEMEPIIADLRKIHATWFVFAEDVNRTGDGSVKGSSPVIISASSRPVTGPSVKP